MFSIEYFSTAYFVVIAMAAVLNYISFNVFSQAYNYSYDMYPKFKRDNVKMVMVITSYLLVFWWPYAIVMIVSFFPSLFFKKQLTVWMRKVSIQSRWGNV